MRKIAIFSNMYPSAAHPTYGIFVKNQADLLQSANVETHVIAIDDPGKGKAAKVKKYSGWFFTSFLFMMKNRKKLDITHAHYAFPTGLLSLIGKRLFKLPYVVTVHGGDIDKMAAKHPLIRKMTQTILQQADAVIVVGDQLRHDVIERFGVNSGRVHLISMGVDTSVFKPYPKAEAKDTLGLPKEKQIVLYVGNIIEAKGLLELTEAFQQVKSTVPDAVLFLIGSTKDESFTAKLQAYIEENKIQCVHLKAPVKQTVLARWISAADVLVLPSHQEGFGLVALEAMAAGTNVVASTVGGLPYLLKDGAGVLVPPKEPQQLSNGIVKVLTDPSCINVEKRDALVQEHSFDQILTRLLAIYDDISKGKATRHE